MTEFETQVIETAIEFVNQSRHGLYKDIPKHKKYLESAIDNLQAENEGDWRPTTD